MDRAVFERMASLDAEHWWFAARRDVVASLIRRCVRPPAGARLLEVGCGTGGNLSMLGQFGRLDAVELDDGARALAAERSGIAVRPGGLPDDLPPECDGYDMVVLLDVLEHVHADQHALAALRRRLRPGGKLVLTVPAYPWLWSRHDETHHHHRRYTAGVLGDRLAAAGYRVVTMSYFNTLLFPLIASVRVLHRLLGIDAADDAMPSQPVNRVLRALFRSERHAIGRLRLPFGVSLAAVAEPA